MIKKLQHRFLFITMACITFIFALILLALNLFMTISNYRQGYTMLEEFAERQIEKEFPSDDFRRPENFSLPENFYPGLQQIRWFNDMRIFSVSFDEAGNLLNISTGGNPNLSDDELKEFAGRVLEKPREKGSIQISLCRHGDKKQLLVRNTGKGIAPKDQKRIFERFYRSDSSRSRQSGGYGLGLSIAQSIVKSHKGQITVKSDGNTYTEFTILLP